MALKAGGKAIIAGAVVVIALGAMWKMDGLGYLTAKQAKPAEVPQMQTLGADAAAKPVAAFQHGGAPTEIKIAKNESGCQIKVVTIPWNAMSSLGYANGGVTTTSDSLMAERGVKLRIERLDMYDQILAQQVKFAEAVKAGDKCPSDGAGFAVIMGDGYPAYIAGAQEAMKKLGQQLQVVGALGYSRGEDKCIIDANSNPRGSLIAGVPGDGDVNICLQYAADNGIKVNTDQKTYDPQAINFVNVTEFTAADEKFIAGATEQRFNVVTKKSETIKVNGSATWTPGDVKVAKERGNIRVLASTKEYMWQMPSIIIGNRDWMRQNPKFVENMLAAAFQAGEKQRGSDAALRKSAEISSLVFKEQSPDYWFKYYKGITENGVELGGSTSNGLGDNLFLFGLNGNDALYKRVYTVFANATIKHFPDFLKEAVPYEDVVNTNYLKTLAANAKAGELVVDKPVYDQAAPKKTFATRNVNIEFATGKADITSAGLAQLNDVLDQLSISGLRVELRGHTDNVGDPAANQLLSKKRAEAVREWLTANAGSTFPAERISARGYGDTTPVADNKTADGKAKNRRVEIVLLTTSN